MSPKARLTYNYQEHPEDWPIAQRIAEYQRQLQLSLASNQGEVTREPLDGKVNADGSLNWSRIPSKFVNRNSTGQIYFIQAGKGAIKIGYTKTVDKRLATLRTASSLSLRLLLSKPGDRQEEVSLHRKFRL